MSKNEKIVPSIWDKVNAKVIAIDFDNTIATTHNINDIRGPEPGALDALAKLKKAGWHILIYSCRNNTSPSILAPGQKDQKEVFQDMVNFLHMFNVPYDAIDVGQHGKPFAQYYIDDKAIRYDKNWPEIVDFILNGG